MRRRRALVVLIVSACGGATRAPSSSVSASASVSPWASASAPTSASASISASTATPIAPTIADDPPPCAPVFPDDAAPVALAWNGCKNDWHWFVTRGLPAISKDGKRIAVADEIPESAIASTNLRVEEIDVDSGKTIDRLMILDVGEFDEPASKSAEAKKTIDARLAKANAALHDLLPLDRCAAPQPWPNDVSFADYGCGKATLPPQTIACATKSDAPTPHAAIVALTMPHLAITVDGKKVIDRDVSKWIETWNVEAPWSKNPQTVQKVPPYLVDVSIDFERRAAVVHTDYCNTTDVAPRFPDAWNVFRLPKPAKGK